MTDSVSQRASAAWQTWLVLAGTAAVGRWLAGGGFGYTLFALVWAPMACLWVVTAGPVWRGRTHWTLAIALFALPWLVERPLTVVATLTGWLALFAGTTTALYRLFHFVRLPRSTAAGLTCLIWSGWLCVPVLMTDAVADAIRDRGLAWVLAVHPVLLMNAGDVTAGDWTHQNIAYAHLTRLGQDFPFAWASIGWGIVVYGIIAVASSGVPRGTLGR